MHITQKGQVTIPREIREQFGFLPNTEVDFVVEDRKVTLRRKRHLSIQEHIQSLYGSMKGKSPFTTEELMKLTRGEDYYD